MKNEKELNVKKLWLKKDGIREMLEPTRDT